MSQDPPRSEKMLNSNGIFCSGMLQHYEQACQARLKLQKKVAQLLPKHLAKDCQIVLNQDILTLFLPQKLSSFWQRFQNETLLEQIQNIPGCQKVQKLQWKILATAEKPNPTATPTPTPQSLAPNVQKDLLALTKNIQHEKLKLAITNLANIGQKIKAHK
jgi:hypothetical protein